MAGHASIQQQENWLQPREDDSLRKSGSLTMRMVKRSSKLKKALPGRLSNLSFVKDKTEVSRSATDIVKRARLPQICVWCEEELAMLQAGERLVTFPSCLHKAHAECAAIHEDGDESSEPGRTEGSQDCPACACTTPPPVPPKAEDRDHPTEFITPTASPGRKLSSVSETASLKTWSTPDSIQRHKDRADSTAHSAANDFAALTPSPMLDNSAYQAMRIEQPRATLTGQIISAESTENTSRLVAVLVRIETSRVTSDNLVNNILGVIPQHCDSVDHVSPSPSFPDSPTRAISFTNREDGQAHSPENLLEGVVEWNGTDIEKAGRLLESDYLMSESADGTRMIERYLFTKMLIVFKVEDIDIHPSKRRLVVLWRLLLSDVLEVRAVPPEAGSLPSIMLTSREQSVYTLQCSDIHEQQNWHSLLVRSIIRGGNIQSLLSRSESDLRYMLHRQKPLERTCRKGSIRTRNEDGYEYFTRLPKHSVEDSLPSRLPCDVIMVVPSVDGAATAPELSILQSTIRLVLGELQQMDRFALIIEDASSTGTSVVVPLCYVTIDHRLRVYRLLSAIYSPRKTTGERGTETTMSTIQRLIRQRGPAAPNTQILLMATESMELRFSRESVDSLKSQRAMVNVFECGVERSSLQLALLADTTFGRYFFLPDVAALPKIVHQTLIDLLTVTHTNVLLDVSLQCDEGLHSGTITQIMGSFGNTVSEDGLAARIFLPYLAYSRPAELMVQIRVAGEAMAKNEFSVSMTYAHPTRCTARLRTKTPACLRLGNVSDVQNGLVDDDLTVRRLELMACRSLTNMMRISEEEDDDDDEARRRMLHATLRVLSESRTSPRLARLIDKLERLAADDKLQQKPHVAFKRMVQMYGEVYSYR